MWSRRARGMMCFRFGTIGLGGTLSLAQLVALAVALPVLSIRTAERMTILDSNCQMHRLQC